MAFTNTYELSKGWCGAGRLLRALAQRTWGAAEICRNTPLLERLGNPGSETTAQEWRFAVVQVQYLFLQSNQLSKYRC